MVIGAIVMALTFPELGTRVSRWGWRGLRRLARRRGAAIIVVGMLAAVGSGLLCLFLGVPVPSVADEFSYLLAADTFAHGRVTNPPHPMWVHFESFHILQQPTYCSKYPPAQGLVLALGWTVGGHPAVGLWIAAGLLGSAVCWMLMAWLPPPWAVAGGLLVVLRLGVGSYWNQSYWGGSVAAIGGALVFGALRRVLDGPRVGSSLLLASGVAILAASRPYEGLLVSIPAAWLLLARLAKVKRARFKVTFLRLLLPAGAVLAVAGGAMAYTNQRSTGHPLRMPYQVYETTYSMRPLFIWQEPNPEPVYRHEGLRKFYTSIAGKPDHPVGWLRHALHKGWQNLSQGWYFILGLALTCSALALPALLRDRWMRFALVPCGLMAVGHALNFSWFPHYSAPITGLLLVIALQGMRILQTRRWRGQRVGRWPLAAAVVINLVLLVVQLPAHRPDSDDWSLRRARILDELEQREGRHLIVVRDPLTATEWVYNEADVDGAKVIWARDMDEAKNRELIEYFRDRRPWLLDDRSPDPVPYPGASR
ncbi:MAG: hypothetical protein GY856_11145 [bacterium]|nr:hypothetical protein [bacterium]